jgi:hypothetical protein
MGASSSRDLGAGERDSPTVQSPHSYFGSSGEMGRKDPADLEETIRDLHRNRLAKYAAEIGPPPGGVRLKTFVAIGCPDPSLKSLRGCRCVCLGIKADVPGRILIAAGNVINSARFPACDRRLVSLPLPRPDRFVVEVSANLGEFKGRIERGFVPVSKHVLDFDCDGTANFVYTAQILYAGERKYAMHINKECTTEELVGTELCLACVAAKAEVPVAECGHAALCKQCALHADVRLHHCPFCDALPQQ